ncbi:uncharacterized protein LOC130726027 [Lotus japonicus]|uniref:uncharacterized protein LOC130726027 n=1 Tax=Lotus japonicus TaxID=34305 RepID=UPI0025884A95|nr:uncharacterized protein LOC130726027 [Lotus japonicus]
MVLISGTGNNKNVLQQTHDERAKAQGGMVVNNSHQQGNRSVESGRTQNLSNTGLIKEMTRMDEFKYGFPSESLSTTSNKWWGSSDHGDSTGTNPGTAKSQPEERGGEAEKVPCKTGNAENSETTQGSSLLTEENVACKTGNAENSETTQGSSLLTEENVACETGNAQNSETPQGSSLLTAVRKRAVEEGREAFKLGVFRGYGVNKLRKREKILLHQIFKSSLPRSWIHDL